jgi:hypothetical protein
MYKHLADCVRSHFAIAVIVAASMLAGCASRKLAHVEVTPKLCWHVHDYAGSIGSADYHNITNYWTTNYYAPFVVSQGALFAMDFARHDSFTSPDTHRDEDYFDGVRVRMAVTVSNAAALFCGRCEYQLHEGITTSYAADDEAMYAQTLSSSSQRFTGSSTLGHEILIHDADSASEPSVYMTFRRTAKPKSKFTKSVVDADW